MARPKSRKTKIRVNLTMKEEIVEKGKEIADMKNKSLSEFTEDMYIIAHDKVHGMLENPMKELKRMQEELSELGKKFKKREETKK